MKRLIGIFAVVFLVFIYGCEEEDEEEPVFQTMYLSHDNVEDGDIDEDAGVNDFTPSVQPLNNGDDLLETYEEDLFDGLPFEESDYDFYTDQSSAVLNIEVDNPQDLPITRFTLNDTNYFIGDYQQHTGGLLQMEVDIDLDDPVNTFSLDEMLYLNQRPVPIEGDDTIEAAITREHYPEVAHLTVRDQTRHGAQFNIDLEGKRFDENEAVLRAMILNDGELKRIKDVESNEESFDVENLRPSEDYTVAFVLVYVMYDGEGLRKELISDYSVSLDPYIAFDNVAASFDELEFELEDEPFDGNITRVMFESDGETIKEVINPDEFVFEGLHAGDTVDVIVEYEYSLDGSNHLDTIQTSVDIPSPVEPNADVREEAIDYHAVTLSAIYNDVDAVGEFSRMDIYKDGELLESVRDTASSVTIDALYAGETLDVFLYYEYDMYDGEGIKSEEIVRSVETESYITPSFSVQDESVTHHEATFDLLYQDPDELGSVSDVAITHEGSVIKTSENHDSVSVDSLDADSEYELVVTYLYDAQDGEGMREGSETYGFTTDAYASPYIDLDSPDVTYDGVTVSGIFNDSDGRTSSSVIHVVKEDETIETFPLDETGEFEFFIDDLKSDSTYEISHELSYDLLDGSGEQNEVTETDVSTPALESPSIDDVHTVQQDASSFKLVFDWDDPYDIVTIDALNLYKDDNLVETKDSNATFESLTPDALYTVEVVYAYDLNDGEGVQSATYATEAQTLPYLNISDVSVSETEMVEYGETITVDVDFDNPSSMSAFKVEVLGNEYALTHEEGDRYQATIIAQEHLFDAGENTLAIDAVHVEHDDETLQYDFDYEGDTFIIYEEPTLNKVKAVDQDGDEILYIDVRTTYELHFEFDNPSNVEIDEIYIDDSYHGDNVFDDFTISDDYQSATLEVESGTLSHKTHLIEVNSFTIDDNEVLAPNIFTILNIIPTDDIQKVSTADELQNMDSNGFYVLENDIDLTGKDWNPYQFRGVLDGNGYAIENLTIEHTVDEDDRGNTHAIGLFESLYFATIKDLELNNFNIDTTMDIPYTTSEFFFNVGALSGWYAKDTRINNVDVNNTTVDVSHMMQGRSNVGGLIGSNSGDVIIENSSTDVDITFETSGETSINSIGGFVGDSNPDDNATRARFDGVMAEGSIETEEDSTIGGLIGNMHDTDVFNAYANVDIKANPGGTIFGIGGMFGYMNNSSVTNAYANSNVSLRKDDYSRLGGLTDNNQQSYLTNVFSLSVDETGETLPVTRDGRNTSEHLSHVYDIEVDGYGQRESLENVLDIMADKWDQNIWSFEDDLPTLKHFE